MSAASQHVHTHLGGFVWEGEGESGGRTVGEMPFPLSTQAAPTRRVVVVVCDIVERLVVVVDDENNNSKVVVVCDDIERRVVVDEDNNREEDILKPWADDGWDTEDSQ